MRVACRPHYTKRTPYDLIAPPLLDWMRRYASFTTDKKEFAMIRIVSKRNEACETPSREKKLLLARNTLIDCTYCSEKFKLSESDFVQDHFYSGLPASSTEGRWQASEVHTCLLCCPTCNELNYIYTHPQMLLIAGILLQSGIEKGELFRALYDRKGTEILPHTNTV